MADLGTLRVTLVANLREFTTQMTTAAARVKTFANKVKAGMARAATAVKDFALRAGRSLVAFTSKWLKRAAIGLVAFGIAAVKMATDVEEGENLVRESFKGMTDSVITWSERLQKELGLNASSLREQAGLLNLLTKSMGLTEEQAFGLSTSITELSVHVASLRNESFAETLEKMRSGLLGMSRPLKDIGINVDENAIKNLLYKQGIDATVSSMTEAEKVMSRYILILQATESDTGDLSRTADDTQNVIRIFIEQVKVLMEELGAKLLPIVNAVAISMRDWLMNNREDIVAWFGTAVDKFTAFIDFLRTDWHQGMSGSLEIIVLVAKATVDAIVAIFKDGFERIGWDTITWIISGWKRGLGRLRKAAVVLGDTIRDGIRGAFGFDASEKSSFGDLDESVSNIDKVFLKLEADIAAVVAKAKEFGTTVVQTEEEIAALEENRIARQKELAALSEANQQKRTADLAKMTAALKASLAATRESTAAMKADLKDTVPVVEEVTSSWNRMWTDTAFTIKRVIQGATDGVTNAFVSGLETMAVEMDNFGDIAKKMLVDIMHEIARMQARLLAAKILGSQSTGGAGGGDFIGNALKFLAGGLGKSPTPAMAHGGLVKPVYAANGFAPRGTDTVPAMLSPGEGVLSKDLTSALRDQLAVPGGADSGPALTINVNTIDTQTTAQWLNSNKRLIAGMIGETRRGNNPASRRLGGQSR